MRRLKYGLLASLASGAFICATTSDTSNAISLSAISSSHIALTLNAGEGIFNTEGISTHTIYVRKGIAWSRVVATAPEKYIKGTDITYDKHTFQYWTYEDEATHKQVQISDAYVFNSNTVLNANYLADSITISLSAYSDSQQSETHGSFESGTKQVTVTDYRSGVKYSDIKDKLPRPETDLEEYYTFLYFVDSNGKAISDDAIFTEDVNLYSHFAVDPGVTDNFCNDSWDVVGIAANKGLEAMATTEEHSGGYKDAYEATEYDYYDEITEEKDTIEKKANTFVGLRRFVTLYEGSSYPTKVPVRVIGENIDVINGTSIKATLTFEFEYVLHGSKVFDDEINYTNNYNYATVKDFINNDMYNALPSNVQSYMPKITKRGHIGGSNGHIDNSTTFIEDINNNYLFMPSLSEKGYYKNNPSSGKMAERDGVGSNNNECYAYYYTDNGTPDADKLKMTSYTGKAVDYWTRSPDVDTGCFAWSIDSTGNISSVPSDVACGLGLDLCFCVGKDTSSRSVTFDVTSRNENGKWSDGTTANKVIELEAGKSFSDACDALGEVKPESTEAGGKWTNKWYSATTGENVVDGSTIVDNNIIVYADYSTAESYTVTYDHTESFTYSGGSYAYAGSDYVSEFTPKTVSVGGKSATLFKCPTSVEITVGGSTLESSYYTFSNNTLTIDSEAVTGNINISFNTTCNSTSAVWDVVAAIASLDENNSQSGNAEPGETANKYMNVGDLFPIAYGTLSGSSKSNYTARLIGLGHSEDTFTSGSNTITSAMTFEFTNCIEDSYTYWFKQNNVSDSEKNGYSYPNSLLFSGMTTAYSNIKNSLTTVNGSLNDNIKSVSKKYLKPDDVSEGTVTVGTVSCKCFALSSREYGNATSITTSKVKDVKDGISYEYYSDCTTASSSYDKMKKLLGTTSSSATYWTRSGVVSKDNSNKTYPTVYVLANGNRGVMSGKDWVFNNNGYQDYYCPAFCL